MLQCLGLFRTSLPINKYMQARNAHFFSLSFCSFLPSFISSSFFFFLFHSLSFNYHLTRTNTDSTMAAVTAPEEYSFDLRHLAAFHTTLPASLSSSSSSSKSTFTSAAFANALLSSATTATTKLVHALFTLPARTDAELGKIMTLPEKTVFPLPREKPLPKQKEKTKWQEFAETKGIKNRKRERMVFDDDADVFRPRFGKDSKRNVEKRENWVIEDKDWKKMNPTEDAAPEQKQKQKQREKKIAPPAAKKARTEERTAELKQAYAKVTKSTASMGKFDRRPQDEGKMGRSIGQKKQRRDAVTQSAKEEKHKAMSALDKVLGRNKREEGPVGLDLKKALKAVQKKGPSRGSRPSSASSSGSRKSK
jgi:regulator of ribosome biosynthesis